MSRDVPFDAEGKCDFCGASGSFDFLGDRYCPDCAVALFAEPEDGSQRPLTKDEQRLFGKVHRAGVKVVEEILPPYVELVREARADQIEEAARALNEAVDEAWNAGAATKGLGREHVVRICAAQGRLASALEASTPKGGR